MPPLQGAAMEQHIDPVCGMTVDPAKAAGTSEYKGRIIYFCNKRCKEKFDANPSQYIK
jgi:Cu+-exporting ATPase